MSGDEQIKINIEKLNEKNFYTWKYNLKMHLVGKDLWEIVSGDEELSLNANADARKRFKKRENQAWSAVCLAVNKELQIHVRHCKTGKEAWDTLCNRFE